MDSFKVNFENNVAISASKVQAVNYYELKELKIEHSKTVIKWCIVDAEFEDEAIYTADKVIREKWGKVLGLK